MTQFSTTIPGLPGGALETTYPVRFNLIPAGHTRQRPGIAAKTPRRSVQHGTGNDSNDDAMAEAQYFVNGAEGRQASVHYCTDDRQAVVVVPLNEVTWQAADGAGPGNMNGFSCEMMEATEIWTNPARRDRLIAITADLMGRTAARLGATVPEQHWTFNAGSADRHDCPNKLRHTTINGRAAWDVYAQQWQAARVDELKRMEGIVDAEPAAIDFPEGMDADLATLWFGSIRTPFKASFNPEGPVSRLWLENGKATGRYPELVQGQRFGTRKYYRFADGLTIWAANDDAAPAILKAA